MKRYLLKTLNTTSTICQVQKTLYLVGLAPVWMNLVSFLTNMFAWIIALKTLSKRQAVQIGDVAYLIDNTVNIFKKLKNWAELRQGFRGD